MFVVYKHTTPNGKVYIGITGNEPRKRWNNGNGYRGNKHFWNAILKYGWDNIAHEILFNGLTQDQAEKKEIELIALYDSANPEKGYNLSIGGYGVSELTRSKMSNSAKIRSNGLPFYVGVGENNPFYGKKHSEESKRKISDASKINCKGKNNPRAKRCICLETMEIFDCILDASEKYGIARSDINSCCVGYHHTAGNLHWSYYEDGKDYSNAICEIEENRKTKEMKVKCIETDCMFDSIKKAAESIGRVPSALTICLKGKTKTCGGYHWTFI